MSNATHARKMDLAVAQMGAVNLADTRAVVVRRLVEMMREAAAWPSSWSFPNWR